MMNHKRPLFNAVCCLPVLLLAAWSQFGQMSRAGVPKPDFVVYGRIVTECAMPFTPEMGVVVEARHNQSGQLVASYLLGQNAAAPYDYVLRVVTDSGEPPYRPGAVLLDETLDIIVRDGETALFHETAYVGSHGFLFQLDFGNEDGSVFEPANAGPDFDVCAAEVQLGAVPPNHRIGRWETVSGEGGWFEDAANPTSLFRGLPGQHYRLNWRVLNPPCDESVDGIEVRLRGEGDLAFAGDDRVLCGTTETQLSARPVHLGEGTWSIIAGVGGWLDNTRDPSTGFYGVSGETYALRWSVDNGACGTDTDDIAVTFQQGGTAPLAVVGASEACTAQPVWLEATPGFQSYRWSDGQTGRGIWVSHSDTTTYEVVATQSDGCQAIALHTVSRRPGALTARLEHGGLALCGQADQTFGLQIATACGDGGPYQIQWRLLHGPLEGGVFDDPSSATPHFTPLGYGAYHLQVTLSDNQGQQLVKQVVVYRIDGDLDGDGLVAHRDWLTRLGQWHTQTPEPEHDLDGSGWVNVLDLVIAGGCR